MSETETQLDQLEIQAMRGRLQAAECAHPEEPSTLWLKLYQADLGKLLPYLEGRSISLKKAESPQDGAASLPPKSPHSPTPSDLVCLLSYLVQSTRECAERTQAGLVKDQLREAMPHLNSAMACFQRSTGEVA